MNFAPYQDDSPETNRGISPSPGQNPATRTQTPRIQSTQSHTKAQPPTRSTAHYEDEADDLPDPEDFDTAQGQNQAERGFGGDQQHSAPQRRGFGNGIGADERNVDVFSTSLPMRLDYEACMAYLLLPPAGGALLLMLEHKSDYVRFHAWQSSLLFTFLFIVHLIFSFSRFVSITLLIFDLILIAYLTVHAYRDADTLDRCVIPYFGRLASSFVDEE